MPNEKDNINEKSMLEKRIVSLFGEDDDDNDGSKSSGYNSPKHDENDSFLTEKRNSLVESEISYPIMNFVGEFDNDNDFTSYDIGEFRPRMDAIVQVGCNKMIDKTCQTDLITSSIGVQCDIKKKHDKIKNNNENNIRDTVIQVGPADYIYKMGDDSTMSSTTTTTTTTEVSDTTINSASEDLAYELFINLIDTKIIHDVFLVFLTFNNFSQQQTNLQNVIETDYLKSFLWEIVFKKNYTQMIQNIIEFLTHIKVPVHAFHHYKCLSEYNQMRFIDKICDDYNLTMNYNSKDFIKKLLIFLSCREDISNFAKLFYLNNEENNVTTNAATVTTTTTNDQNQYNNNINQDLPSYPDNNYQNSTYHTNYNENLNQNTVFNYQNNISSTNYDINQNSNALQNSYHAPNRTYQHNKTFRYNRNFTSRNSPINYSLRNNYNPASVYSAAAKSSSVLSSHFSPSSATINRSLSEMPANMNRSLSQMAANKSFPPPQISANMNRPLSQMPSTMNGSFSQMPLFMSPPLPQTSTTMNPPLPPTPATMNPPLPPMPATMNPPLPQTQAIMNIPLPQTPANMNPPLPQTSEIMNIPLPQTADLHQPPPNVITPETSPVLSQSQSSSSSSSILSSLLLNDTYSQNDIANTSYYNNSVSTVCNSDNSSLNNQLSPSANAFSNYNLNATIRYENSSYSSISNYQQNYNDITTTNQQQSGGITNSYGRGVIQSHQNVFNNTLYSNDSYLPQLSGSDVMQELNRN